MADDFASSLTDTSAPFGQLSNGVAVGNVEVFGDHDWFTVQLSAFVTYAISMKGAPSGAGTLLDPILAVRDSTGKKIAEDDDSGTGLDSLIFFTPLATGTYFIDAASRFNLLFPSQTGTYSVSVTQQSLGDDYADFIGDTLAPLGDFGTVGLGSTISAIGTADGVVDHDFFKAQLIAGVSYKITLQGAGFVDPILRLHDAAGTVIRIDEDDAGTVHSFIAFTPKTTGTYYIDAAEETLVINTYTVTVSAFQDPFRGAAETSFWSMNGNSLPASQAANLSQFAQTQFTYGQQIGVLDPTVYTYEALGQALSEGSFLFDRTDGPWRPSVGPATFVSQAYASIFGFQPAHAQIEHFLEQLDYFESIYVASGAFGPDITRIQILARGAVFGQIMGIGIDTANNASTVPADLIDGNSISTAGGLTTVDVTLL